MAIHGDHKSNREHHDSKLVKLERAKQIYETWRRVGKHAAGYLILGKGMEYHAMLWEPDDDFKHPDVTEPSKKVVEVITFIVLDGYIVCEDQVLSNIKHWK